jgi:hypothetical protein
MLSYRLYRAPANCRGFSSHLSKFRHTHSNPDFGRPAFVLLMAAFAIQCSQFEQWNPLFESPSKSFPVTRVRDRYNAER